MLELFITSFVTFLVVVDPFGNVPIFLSLVAEQSDRAKRLIVFRAVAVAFAVLTVFLFVGEALLAGLGIGLPAFQIAGGILLFVIAFEMLFDKRRARREENARDITSDEFDESDSAESAASGDDLSLGVFPLAIPLLAGPGAFAAAILTGSNTDGWADQGMALAALAAVLLLAMTSLIAAARFHKLLGSTFTDVFTRLLGVLLAALSVQYVIDGVRALI